MARIVVLHELSKSRENGHGFQMSPHASRWTEFADLASERQAASHAHEEVLGFTRSRQ